MHFFNRLLGTKTKNVTRCDSCAYLYELGEAGVRGVVWTGGGEPTIHPELWNYILV